MLNFRHTSKQNWARGYFESQVNILSDEDKGGTRIDFSIIGNRKVIQTSIFNKIKVNLPSFLQILQKHSSVKGSWIIILQKRVAYYLEGKNCFLKIYFLKRYFFLQCWAIIHSREPRHNYQIFLNAIFPLVCFCEQMSQSLFGCMPTILRYNAKTYVFKWKCSTKLKLSSTDHLYPVYLSDCFLSSRVFLQSQAVGRHVCLFH